MLTKTIMNVLFEAHDRPLYRYAAMRRISLHHLTALDATPAELVRLAAEADCPLVTLFTHMPPPHRLRYPMVEPQEAEALATLMAELGVGCHSVEVFPLVAKQDWTAVKAGLETGCVLGARYAVVHSHLPDLADAAEQLIRLSDLAGERGILPAIEFNAFSQCTSLGDALTLRAAATTRGAEVELVLDTLHAARAGTDPAMIGDAAEAVSYVQLSDGLSDMPADRRWREAISERLRPGEGALPLGAILAALPPDLICDIEAPSRLEREQGFSPRERCRRAIEQTRAFLGSLPS